jgi:cell division septation protein DedD
VRDAELSLEKRKPIALAVCAFLLLGVIFTLGLLIGRKTAALQPPVQFGGDLALLDAQARSPATPPARPQAPAKTEPAGSARSPEPAEKVEPVRVASIVPAPPKAATIVPPAPVRPVQVPSPAPVALTPPPRELGEYTVQLGATQEKTDAARLEGRARGAGLKAYVQEADLGARGTWYRVRVGAFRDKDSANRFRKDVERELRIAAVVMPAH